VAPTDTTIYIVAVSDGSQIHHDTTRDSVVPAPFVFVGNDTTVCSYIRSIQLHGEVANHKSFIWGSSGNGGFSDRYSLNPVYTFGTHDYQVDSVDIYLVVFANSPCPGRINGKKHVALDPCTGIPPVGADNQDFIVRPNPARESATIILDGLLNKQTLLTLTDMKGKVMFSEEIVPSTQSFLIKLDFWEYSPGIYFIQVKSDEKVMIKKLVVY